MGLLQPATFVEQMLSVSAILSRSCNYQHCWYRRVLTCLITPRTSYSSGIPKLVPLKFINDTLFGAQRWSKILTCHQFSSKSKWFHSKNPCIVDFNVANIRTQSSRFATCVVHHHTGLVPQSADISLSFNNFKDLTLSQSFSTKSGSSSDHTMTSMFDSDASMMQEAREIFYQAVNAVLPHQMIGNRLEYNKSTSVLKVDGHEYKLHKNVHVVGFGKAVLGMARAVDDCIGEHIVRGVISIPVGAQEALRQEGKQDMLLQANSKISVREGAASNLPDEAAYKAAREITAIVEEVGERDVLIVLISGGGSALLPAPKPPVTLTDMLSVTQLMSRAGASIMHLNTVRKQTDLLKGGGLAKMAYPAQVISLILSDVIGDPLDFIASGPTVPDLSTPQECLDLFSQFGVTEQVPASVMNVLQENAQNQDSTHSSEPDSQQGANYSHVQNLLVGTNQLACHAACKKSRSYGYLPYVLSTELDGEARNVGKMFASLAYYIGLCLVPDAVKGDEDVKKTETNLMRKWGINHEKLCEIQEHVRNLESSKHFGICIVAGGETTVTVRGNGKGGRNQEMAVSAALELSEHFTDFGHRSPEKLADSDSSSSCDPSSPVRVVFLSAGTDGQDGPTSAAGGVVNIDFAACVQASGLISEEYLERNDTHTLLTSMNNGTSLVVTGLTGTNVMDIHLLLVKTPRHN